jgi:hypothetical protein
VTANHPNVTVRQRADFFAAGEFSIDSFPQVARAIRGIKGVGAFGLQILNHPIHRK